MALAILRKMSYICGAMSFSEIRKYRIAGALALLVLFCTYTGSITLFMHRHIVKGYVVVHSHPYKNAPDTAGHTHTAQQFGTIAALSLFVAIAAVAALCPTVAVPDVSVIFSDGATRRMESSPVRHYGLRAPPASLS